MYRLVASDMDETFLDADHAIPASNLRALKRMRELGVLFVPSSGRWYSSIMDNFSGEDRELIEGGYVLSYNGGFINRVGDPAIWGSDGTESIGALMERQRVYFERGDHARIDGKMQVHHRLAFDEEGIPMLYVFNTCKHFIRTVPNLVYDEKNVEDINTEGEDHIYDELRYVCMKNPIAPRRNKPPALVVYDPLDLGQDQQYDRYDFYRRY